MWRHAESQFLQPVSKYRLVLFWCSELVFSISSSGSATSLAFLLNTASATSELTAFLGTLTMFILFSHSKRNSPVVTISNLLCWLVFPWFVRQNINDFHLEDRVQIISKDLVSDVYMAFHLFWTGFTSLPLCVIWKRRAKHDGWSCVHGIDDCWHEYYDSGKGLGSRQLRTRGLQNLPFQPSDK